MNQLVGLAEDHTKFEETGAQVIALAVQPQNGAAQSVEKSKAQFPILADSEHAVADAYGVYNLFSDTEAAASVFMISKDGRIVWDHIATYQTERVGSKTILENLPGAEAAKTEQPAVEEENVPKVSVTLSSTAHSSDLGGYAWLQEYLSSNDIDAADAKSWSESARAGAVCFASIAPSNKSEPSAVDGSFSITFEAEPGSTFRIMCDPDETHPGALGIDVFTVPAAGGIIDHATAGFLYPGLLTPELGVANELAAQAAGYADAEEMFQSAGTCRVLALPGEGATIAVSDGDAYGFYMEAPNTAGRVTILTEPAGAYIVIKEFEAGDVEAEIDIEFTDTSGAGLTWPSATCPIKKGFSTNLDVLPEIAADFTLPDSNGNMVNLADELQENEQVVLVFYYTYQCPQCMEQLGGIENDRAKYEEMGAQVIAVAVQSDRGAEASAKTSGAQFPILADKDHAVAEAYGVYDLLPEDDGLSTPSVFVIDQDRHIVWKHIASSIFEEGEEPSYPTCGGERVPSQTILENLLE